MDKYIISFLEITNQQMQYSLNINNTFPKCRMFKLNITLSFSEITKTINIYMFILGSLPSRRSSRMRVPFANNSSFSESPTEDDGGHWRGAIRGPLTKSRNVTFLSLGIVKYSRILTETHWTLIANWIDKWKTCGCFQSKIEKRS